MKMNFTMEKFSSVVFFSCKFFIDGISLRCRCHCYRERNDVKLKIEVKIEKKIIVFLFVRQQRNERISLDLVGKSWVIAIRFTFCVSHRCVLLSSSWPCLCANFNWFQNGIFYLHSLFNCSENISKEIHRRKKKPPKKISSTNTQLICIHFSLCSSKFP